MQANLILALGELFAPREGDSYASKPPPHRPPARKEEWDFFEHIWQTADQQFQIFCASLVIARIAGKNIPQEVASFLTDVTMAQTLSEELSIFQLLPCAGYSSQVVTIAATSALKGRG